MTVTTELRLGADRSPEAMRALARLPKRSYDWDRLRETYVQGEIVDGVRVWPSCQAIADAERMYVERVRQTCARQGWVEQRRAFRDELATAARRKAQEQAVDLVADLDVATVEGSCNVVRLVCARLRQIEAEVNRQQTSEIEYDRLVAGGMHAAQAATESRFDRWAAAVDARELQVLASAMQTALMVAHRAVGEISTTRVEVTGRASAPVEVKHPVREKSMPDDPARLLALFQAAARATFGEDEALEAGVLMDADVVEEM